MVDIILIILVVVIAYFVYRYLKPYFVKYDTTILYCGGLGSGKSLNSVKQVLLLYKKNHNKWLVHKYWNNFKNLFRKSDNKKLFIEEEPLIYSNIPIRIKKNKLSTMLNKEHLMLKERINQKSIVFIDELPTLVNQFNWSIKEVKYNLNEFITFFRHYIGGYLVVNGQAESEIVKQVRVKLNSYYWCFDFKKFLCFYRVKILHSMISENDISLSTSFIDENCKKTYGIITKNYNTRAFKNRYDKVVNVDNKEFKNEDLTTNRIIRFEDYKSDLDDIDDI